MTAPLTGEGRGGRGARRRRLRARPLQLTTALRFLRGVGSERAGEGGTWRAGLGVMEWCRPMWEERLMLDAARHSRLPIMDGFRFRRPFSASFAYKGSTPELIASEPGN